ncbi:sulfhydryl oxidase 2-like [Humulus lupulus]|uniref:sulfhydryl oxidase 2-like n=1 Tax=Humulus lupulus TaxID=3486 RepID=UPI002B405A18|nr:sulfhydryl oxidase 2-like [Humulus lupulus]
MSSKLWNTVLSLFLLSFFGWSSASSGSRSILREIGAENGDPRDYGVDLNLTNFDSVLKDTPATYAVVEFFAHWSPACRNYKPHYEKVARLFNGPDAVHPGIVLMTRVDCASKINTKLCDRFSVSHYPMLFWGPPSKFVGGSWEPKKEKSEILVIDDGRTADRLLNWINKQLGSSFSLDDEKFENDHLPSNVSDPGQIARAVYDVEEATTTALEIILDTRCRKGSAEILVNFDDLFPSDLLLADKQEENDGKSPLSSFQICGKDVPRGYWKFCRGSKNEWKVHMAINGAKRDIKVSSEHRKGVYVITDLLS